MVRQEKYQAETICFSSLNPKLPSPEVGCVDGEPQEMPAGRSPRQHVLPSSSPALCLSAQESMKSPKSS